MRTVRDVYFPSAEGIHRGEMTRKSSTNFGTRNAAPE